MSEVAKNMIEAFFIVGYWFSLKNKEALDFHVLLFVY
jgi:hypothetical protein